MVSTCETDIYSCAIAKLLAISLGSAPSHSIRDAREGCKVVVPHKLVGWRHHKPLGCPAAAADAQDIAVDATMW